MSAHVAPVQGLKNDVLFDFIQKFGRVELLHHQTGMPFLTLGTTGLKHEASIGVQLASLVGLASTMADVCRRNLVVCRAIY